MNNFLKLVKMIAVMSENKFIINENGEMLVADPETQSKFWVPANQVHQISEESLELESSLLWLFLLPFGLMVLSLEAGPFLDFDNLPDTNFTCVGKVIGGYYADLETNCQMFHVCTIGQADEPMDIRFLCLNGTVFDQETRVCERIDEVDCSKSEQFYSLNLELYGNSGPILEESPEVPQETESPSITINPTTSTTTTTTTKRPTAKQTNSPYFTTIRPPSATTAANSHQNVAGHHFRVNNPDIRFNPEEINISLNPGAPPDIRTKHFDPHHIYSDSSKVLVSHNGDNDEEQSVRVQKPERISGSTSTSPKSIYTVDVSDSEKLPQNSDDNFGFSDDFRGTELPRHQQFLIQTNSFRHSQSFPPNVDRSSNQYHHPQFHSTTVKQPGHTTDRTFYLHSLKPPQITQHQHYTHHPRTEKTPQRVQIPIPLLPTLPPLTFSTPAPFTLQRHIENKRYTKDHQAPPRIIISASASVSDASGRRLNYSLGTIGAAQILETPPSSYDEYKDSDVGLDPFYHDVPKVKQKKRRKRSADTRKLNPFEIIKNEKEAVEVLKFLFTWYQSHQATATVPPSTSPASPDLIREINDELGPANGLKTDSSEFHFTSAGEPSSSEKSTPSSRNSELFKKSSRFSIVGGYRNDNQKPRRKIKDKASRRITVVDSRDLGNTRGLSEGKHSVSIAEPISKDSDRIVESAPTNIFREDSRNLTVNMAETVNKEDTKPVENESGDSISTSTPRNDAVLKEKMDDADDTILKNAKEHSFNPDDYVDDNYEGVVYKENNDRINVTTLDEENKPANKEEHNKKDGFIDPHAVAELYKYFNINNQLTTTTPTILLAADRRTMHLPEEAKEEKPKESTRFTEINILSQVNESSEESGSSSTTTTTTPPRHTARRRGRGRQRVVDSYQEASFTSSISKEQVNGKHESRNYITGNGLNKRGKNRNRSRFINSHSTTTQASTTEVATVATESSSILNLDQIYTTTEVSLVTSSSLGEATEAVSNSEYDDNFNLDYSPNFDTVTKTFSALKSEGEGEEPSNEQHTDFIEAKVEAPANDTVEEDLHEVNDSDIINRSLINNTENDRSRTLANTNPIEDELSELENNQESNHGTYVDLVHNNLREFESEKAKSEDEINPKEANLDNRRDKDNDNKQAEHEKEGTAFEDPKNAKTLETADEDTEHLETTTLDSNKATENTDFSIITKTDTITVESTTEPLIIKKYNIEPVSELTPIAPTTDSPSYLIKLLRYYAESAMTSTEQLEVSYDALTEHVVTSTIPPSSTTRSHVKDYHRVPEGRRHRPKNRHRNYPRSGSTTDLPTLRDIYETTGPLSVEIDVVNPNTNSLTEDEKSAAPNSNSSNQTDSDKTSLHNASTIEEPKQNKDDKTKTYLLEKLTLIEQSLAGSSTSQPETSSLISDTTVTTPLVSFEDPESFATTFSPITESTRLAETIPPSQELTKMFQINMEETTTTPTPKHENVYRNYDTFYDDLFVVPELTEKSLGYDDHRKEGQSHTRLNSNENVPEIQSNINVTTNKMQVPISSSATVTEGVIDPVTTPLPDVEIQKSISIPISVLETSFDVPNDVNHAQDINGLVSSERDDDDNGTVSSIPIFSSTPSFTNINHHETTETVPFTITAEVNHHQETSTINYLEETKIPVVQENATEILFLKSTDANEVLKNDSTVLPPNVPMDMPGTINSSHLLQVSVETTSEPITTVSTTTTSTTSLYTRKTRPTRKRPYKGQRNQFGRHRFSTELFTKKPPISEEGQYHKVHRKNITDAPLHRSVSPTRSELKKVSLHTTPLSSKHQYRAPTKVGKYYVFNCFGKEINRFYADPRDCRLFHYCTQGYSKNQLLDLKYVCDQKTFFDEDKLICTKVKPSRCL